jgi:hypothetical protein
MQNGPIIQYVEVETIDIIGLVKLDDLYPSFFHFHKQKNDSM